MGLFFITGETDVTIIIANSRKLMEQPGDFLMKKQSFVANKKGKIEDSYEFTNKLLGSGACGTVLKGRLKGQTNHSSWRAIKKIPKNKLQNRSKFLNEIQILQKLDHPNIIKLYETFEDQNHIYMVTQICTGGELFDKILDKGCFTQQETRVIFKQIMLALNYCHSQKIAHRDLKPENFMFSNRSKDSPLKLIDFGFSLDFDSQKKTEIKTMVGTSYYIAPEAMDGIYNEKCDIWSVGVILYILLTGVPPFNGDSDQQIFEAVKNQQYTFDVPEMEGVSEGVKELIASILVPSDKRLTAEEILNHPWVTHGASTECLHINMERMKEFSSFGKFKKMVMMMIASQVNDKEILELDKIFKSIDVNHDGVLTVDEIRDALVLQKDQSQLLLLDQILTQMQTVNNGIINYSYFVASCLKEATFLKEDNIKMIFQMMDFDQDGRIGKDQLSEIFTKPEFYMGQEYFLEMIRECDKNGDGYIDYNEFVQMLSETAA